MFSFKSTISAWRVVFMTAATFYIIPAIVFIIYGRAEVQKFDRHASEKARDLK